MDSVAVVMIAVWGSVAVVFLVIALLCSVGGGSKPNGIPAHHQFGGHGGISGTGGGFVGGIGLGDVGGGGGGGGGGDGGCGGGGGGGGAASAC